MTAHEEAAQIYADAAGDARVALFEMKETDADKALREAIIRRVAQEIDRDRLKAEPGWQAYERNTKWACGEIAWRDKVIAELREKLRIAEEFMTAESARGCVFTSIFDQTTCLTRHDYSVCRPCRMQRTLSAMAIQRGEM